MAGRKPTHTKSRYIFNKFLWIITVPLAIIEFIRITYSQIIPGGQWAFNTTVTEWASHGDAMPLNYRFYCICDCNNRFYCSCSPWINIEGI
jgi:hypothetical protein